VRIAVRIAVLGALAGLIALPAAAQSLTVTGLDGQAHPFSAAQLAAMPQVKASLKAKDGATHLYQGPALSSLLQAAGAPSGEALKGPDMADVVMVSAMDGYRVAFSLAETDASIRNETMIVAIAEDGQPLDAKDGPLRLVVEGDARAARSVRMVTAVSMVRPPAN
jgi:hypothetical protein